MKEVFKISFNFFIAFLISFVVSFAFIIWQVRTVEELDWLILVSPLFMWFVMLVLYVTCILYSCIKRLGVLEEATLKHI